MNKECSITQRIKNAVTQEVSALVDAVMIEAASVRDDRTPEYFIHVEPGYEKLVLQLRNSLKEYGCKFNVKKDGLGYLFGIYGEMNDWIAYLTDHKSPLLETMEFA